MIIPNTDDNGDLDFLGLEADNDRISDIYETVENKKIIFQRPKIVCGEKKAT